MFHEKIHRNRESVQRERIKTRIETQDCEAAYLSLLEEDGLSTPESKYSKLATYSNLDPQLDEEGDDVHTDEHIYATLDYGDVQFRPQSLRESHYENTTAGNPPRFVPARRRTADFDRPARPALSHAKSCQDVSRLGGESSESTKKPKGLFKVFAVGKNLFKSRKKSSDIEGVQPANKLSRAVSEENLLTMTSAKTTTSPSRSKTVHSSELRDPKDVADDVQEFTVRKDPHLMALIKQLGFKPSKDVTVRIVGNEATLRSRNVQELMAAVKQLDLALAVSVETV